MNALKTFALLVSFFAGLGSLQATAAEDSSFARELLSIQQEFDVASFTGLKKSDRKQSFETLVEHAADFSARYPDRAEAVAWNGIVLSTFAGEVSALGAMKYAKAARDSLRDAESMTPTALDGGLYASLGALYAKVPGGFVGFGDDDLAAEYFEKALAVNPDNMDSNYFYGEFLLEQEQYQRAETVLARALRAPKVVDRPLFDSGRREMIRDLLATAREHSDPTAASAR
jgi:tetratricopeptide (TPR) repeat protein